MSHHDRRRTTALIVVAVVIVALCLASVVFGARDIALGDVIAALRGHDDTIAQTAVNRRIPRTLLALVVGASLGLSGAVMQGITRNPLADPGLLGVTAGASLAVVATMAFVGISSPIAITWVAVVGAAVTAVFVYQIGSAGRGGATPLKLALAGAAISAALSSLTSAVMLPRLESLNDYRFWQIGGVGGASTESLVQVLPFLIVGAVLCLLSARGLNSLALGDDLAAGLGEKVARTRALAALGSVLLCGAATALAGPIGFVGLVVPHACRLLVGPDHRWLLPFSLAVGAALLVASDILGRVVARPDEIDVGIITALLGAPIFIAIVRRQRARAL